MAYENDDLYGDDDLYKDLDDLEANVLEEELVDPDHIDPPPAAAQQQPQQNTQASSSAAYDQSSNDAKPNVGGMAGSAMEGIKQEGGQESTRPSDMPDEGKMFIGGLNWETTDERLKEYMGEYGEIESCSVMRDPSGRSRGFAFLTYKHADSVNKVLAKSHHLDGKQIDPKRAIPRAEHERTAKVFVGGLAANVTSEILKDFLSRFGIVMDATVMFDKETTRSKGFAFATFQDEDSVQRAMDASGIELQGKAIEIKRAQPRGSGNLPKQFGAVRPGGFQQNNGGFNNGGGGFDPNAMAMMYQNMMKGSGMGMNMGGGFDPNAMAMMYQNMMKNMGGMGNAPAINPNMARGGMGMGMGGMGGMGMGNMMGMMGNNMMGMGGMGMGMGMGGMGGMGNNMGYNNNMGGASGMVGPGGRAIPNAPKGPAAMRSGGQGPSDGDARGPGAQRYSTQGNARAKPY